MLVSMPTTASGGHTATNRRTHQVWWMGKDLGMDTSRIEAVHGDITAQDTDAIVNAANVARRGRWCRRGHPSRRGRRRAPRPRSPRSDGASRGDAKATPGFALPVR